MPRGSLVGCERNSPATWGHSHCQLWGEGGLKSICVHLSPRSSCGLVAYTLRILAQWYTFFMGHTATFLLVGIKA